MPAVEDKSQLFTHQHLAHTLRERLTVVAGEGCRPLLFMVPAPGAGPNLTRIWTSPSWSKIAPRSWRRPSWRLPIRLCGITILPRLFP